MASRNDIAGFLRELEAAEKLFFEDLNKAYRHWAYTIFKDIVTLSPQWSGNLAANWYFDIDSVTSTAQNLGDTEVRRSGQTGGKAPYSRGLDPAVSEGLSHYPGDTSYTITSNIYIHNPVDYAEKVEKNTPPYIRAVNLVETGEVAMVQYAYHKYNFLQSNILLV